MIEINLLPGSAKKQKRTSPGPLANVSLPKFDRIVGLAVAMWVVGIALILWMHLSTSTRLADLTIQEEGLVADTTRVQAQLAQNRLLTGKRDTVTAKLTLIQELDAGRYNWAHILDEVSRSVPDYTWLVSITPSNAVGGLPAFIIEGRMGNAFALPKFMKTLEDSPFITNVALRSSASVVEDQKSLYSFLVEARYEEPPLDMITTVPLFAADRESAADAMPGTPAGPPATTPAPAAPAGRE